MNVLMALLHLYGRLAHGRPALGSSRGGRRLPAPPPALAPAVLIRASHPSSERLTRRGPS